MEPPTRKLRVEFSRYFAFEDAVTIILTCTWHDEDEPWPRGRDNHNFVTLFTEKLFTFFSRVITYLYYKSGMDFLTKTLKWIFLVRQPPLLHAYFMESKLFVKILILTDFHLLALIYMCPSQWSLFSITDKSF